MCVDVACVRASEVCWFGFEGGLLGAAWVLEGVGCMCDYVVLPLLNSSFEPGRAREVVEGFVDVDLRNIARAELFYFTGRAEECCEITRGYLSSRVIELRLSACILYGYSNLTLGNVAAVLLHLPTDGMPAFGEYSRMLPEGLRLFATYVMAHHTYLNGEIWSAYGMGKAALFMADRSYPISMTYIHCMMAVCAINRKHKQEAQEEMLRSWELAKMDGFLEPFIEHHGLLRGLIEACIRNRDPEAYQRITEGVISFSRGWMALHNPENRRKVTGELSTMEFSIAMLASGGWTNKEIGEHLGISINTVKHYLTDIFCKLNVKKRDELKKFMLK
jgi:DNA-binding CsgD family transcriptional regulator